MGTPEFKQYPAGPAYTGKPASVVLQGEAERFYRTRLREAVQKPANFAGKYVLARWGCGSGCTDGAVISLRSGAVFFLPGALHARVGVEEPLQFRLDSRLLILSRQLNEKGVTGIFYYEWTGDGFRHLKTLPVESFYRIPAADGVE